MKQPDVIRSLPVVRNRYGHWMHPAFVDFCGDRDYVPENEFEAFLSHADMEWVITTMDCDDGSPAAGEYELHGSFYAWQPDAPHGEGWFIGSMYESEDCGPTCLWLRSKPCEVS